VRSDVETFIALLVNIGVHDSVFNRPAVSSRSTRQRYTGPIAPAYVGQFPLLGSLKFLLRQSHDRFQKRYRDGDDGPSGSFFCFFGRDD